MSALVGTVASGGALLRSTPPARSGPTRVSWIMSTMEPVGQARRPAISGDGPRHGGSRDSRVAPGPHTRRSSTRPRSSPPGSGWPAVARPPSGSVRLHVIRTSCGVCCFTSSAVGVCRARGTTATPTTDAAIRRSTPKQTASTIRSRSTSARTASRQRWTAGSRRPSPPARSRPPWPLSTTPSPTRHPQPTRCAGRSPTVTASSHSTGPPSKPAPTLTSSPHGSPRSKPNTPPRSPPATGTPRSIRRAHGSPASRSRILSTGSAGSSRSSKRPTPRTRPRSTASSALRSPTTTRPRRSWPKPRQDHLWTYCLCPRGDLNPHAR
jgi:hypothetical protein